VLELQAIRHAIAGLHGLALPDSLRVWLNVSAATIIAGGVEEALGDLALDRVVLELTEHDHVDDYHALGQALQPLRRQGLCVAIDDAGAGYSSMSHILNMEPEYIKLDLSLTRSIDVDRKRCALAAALIEFGRQTGAKIVSEGVESIAELNELKRLGVQMAQGYFLAEPVRGEQLAAVLDALHGRSDFDGP
jgi:EAL domain-containing protein (putative c-di-GMP-specific phosphodiesterase class I)